MEIYAQSWDNTTQLTGQKQFIIIRQCDQTWKPYKYSQTEIKDYVNRTMKLMEYYSDNDELFDAINNLTQDSDLAFLLRNLIPEICCQFVLPEVKYSNQIILMMPDNTEITMYTSQLSIYQKIKKSVFEILQSNYNKERTMKILCFGSVFWAIHNCILEGGKLEDLITGPLSIRIPKNNPFR